jgi:hypothetical protein
VDRLRWNARYAVLLVFLVLTFPPLLNVVLDRKTPAGDVSLASADLNQGHQGLIIKKSVPETGTSTRDRSTSPQHLVPAKNSLTTSVKNEADPLLLRLKELERSLVSLSVEYTDAHPDIISLKQQIADLKVRLEEKYGSQVAVNDPSSSQKEAGSKRQTYLAAELGTLDAGLDGRSPGEAGTNRSASGHFVTASSSPIVTEEKLERGETARLLAVLLDSGRVVVGRVQPTLNNPRLENKNFSRSVFESQLRKEFLVRTGHDLRNLVPAPMPERAKPLLLRLGLLMQKAVEEVQPEINKKGIGFKGFIPAVFGTKVSEQFSKEAGVKLRQIGPPGIEPRNPNNKPDEQEEQALLGVQQRHPRVGDHVVEQQLPDNTIQVLLPLFYNKQCLACHGKPKGGVDISGYEKEGFKEGDLGGAISVTLSAENQLLKAQTDR